MKTYYVAAGVYEDSPGIESFKLVGPVNGHPYVATSPEDIKHTWHHSSIYALSGDFKTATLIVDHHTIKSPQMAKLSPKQIQQIKDAIAYQKP